MLRIDHVVRAVADLDAADERCRAIGIATVAGGTHPRWGTGNRIAPLGDARYLELLAVLDPARAAGSALGSAVDARARGGDSWFALCLADDDLDATAARLGLEVRAGDRTLPDGSSIAWRSAGMEDPTRTPDLPFFIE